MATIKDVAREAGLTVGTVSRVLNNRGYISLDAKEKVYRAMERLHYKPNELARSLSKQKTSTIGVIVPHIEHPYFARLISCLERAASDQKHKILLFNSREETELELEYVETCKSNRVSGIILCGVTVHSDGLKNLSIPVISLEREQEAGTASVECDNMQGGMIAAKHLISKGCKSLLYFSGMDNPHMSSDALEAGFVRICDQYGVAHKEVRNNLGLCMNMEYHTFIETALRENEEADGIFTGSDLIAAYMLQECSRLELPVPGRIKIVGYDDVNIASLTTPLLTTIRRPLKKMAEIAVALIINSNRGEVVPTKTMLPVALVERGTT